MATVVTLKTVWLNSASEPSDYVQLSGVTSLDRKPKVRGRIDELAGGRRRGIRQAGRSDSWALDLPFRTAAQVEWLELHLGQTLCARDDRGNKFFCWYLELPIGHYKHTKGAAVIIVLDQITFSQAV